MKRLFGKTFDILQRSIELKVQRNAVITSNITNLDTPGYKAKDIPFKEIMARYMDNPQREGLSLKMTNAGHIGGVAGTAMMITDKGHIQAAGSHGEDIIINRSNETGTPNNVDLDNEMAELAINNIQFQETVQSLIKQFTMLKTAITEGSKV